MSRYTLIMIFVSFVCVTNVYSKNQTVKLRKGTVTFELPSKKWNYYKDMLGLPLVIVGPSIQKQRVTVSVTPTGVKKLKLNPEKLKSEQSSWFSGRKRFVDKFNGQIIKKYNYESVKTAKLSNVHKIGYRYTVENKTFESYSFYFNCKDKLFHIKSLRETNLFPDADKLIDQFLNSLNCL